MDHCPHVDDPAHKAAIIHEGFDILHSGFRPPSRRVALNPPSAPARSASHSPPKPSAPARASSKACPSSRMPSPWRPPRSCPRDRKAIKDAARLTCAGVLVYEEHDDGSARHERDECGCHDQECTGGRDARERRKARHAGEGERQPGVEHRDDGRRPERGHAATSPDRPIGERQRAARAPPGLRPPRPASTPDGPEADEPRDHQRPDPGDRAERRIAIGRWPGRRTAPPVATSASVPNERRGRDGQRQRRAGREPCLTARRARPAEGIPASAQATLTPMIGRSSCHVARTVHVNVAHASTRGRTRVVGHSFSPLDAIDWTMYRCATNTTSTGTIAIVIPAAIVPSEPVENRPASSTRPDGQRLRLGVVDHHQRQQQVVPPVGEAQDAEGRDRRSAQRQDDPGERAAVTGAVDASPPPRAPAGSSGGAGAAGRCRTR